MRRLPPSLPLLLRAFPRALLALLFSALFALLAPARALAQPQSPPASPAPVVGDSPRATVTGFLQNARAGRYAAAAQYLRAPGRPLADPEGATRELAAALDHFLVLEPAALSDRPEGRLDDGLAPHLEEIGRIPTPDGPQPVQLIHLASGQWVFSRETIAHAHGWYDLIGNRWLRERLPPVLQRTGPFGLSYWQWIALPLVVLTSIALGRLLGLLLTLVLRAIARRTAATLDDRLVERLRRPRNLLLMGVLGLFLLPYLELSARVEQSLTRGIDVVLFFAVLWAVVRAVDITVGTARTSRYVGQHPSLLGLLPLVTTLGKIVLFLLWLLSLMQWWGLPVASVVASLGIGGLAIALAAKTTLENLLSAVTLAVDQPFRPGDFIKVEELQGTVEAIGLRSTRVRTSDRTVVTVPNGKLADMKIESFAPRDRMKLYARLPIPSSVTAAQLERVIEGVRAVLLAQKDLWPDDMIVALREFTGGPFEVEVTAWLRSASWNEFLALRQRLYLAFLSTVEKAGTRLALPTQIVRVVGNEPREKGTADGAREEGA